MAAHSGERSNAPTLRQIGVALGSQGWSDKPLPSFQVENTQLHSNSRALQNTTLLQSAGSLSSTRGSCESVRHMERGMIGVIHLMGL